jgi:hypothetical protein
MKLYSQRDTRWRDEYMGNGTLGQYGCLVTCISMISETDPDVLNREIKSIGGYDDNNLIWDKLDNIKGLDFIKRVRIYDNTDVLNNIPCIVEVDGTPIGGITHWVLYIGNKRCYDPWDAEEKATSRYNPIGYAVVKYSLTPTFTFTDQTKLPKELLGTKEDLEVQQIRGKLNDLERLSRIQIQPPKQYNGFAKLLVVWADAIQNSRG